MNFLKENTPKISRLIITHIAMSVFGLSLFFTTNLMEPSYVMLFASIASALFFAVIVYTTMWEFGAKDKPAFDADRLSKPYLRGFAATFVAELFWIILAVVYAVVSIFNINIASIVYVIEFLTSCCFTGIEVYLKNYVLSDGSVLTPIVVSGVYVVGSLFVCVFGMLGYALGTKDMTIVPRKNKAKK